MKRCRFGKEAALRLPIGCGGVTLGKWRQMRKNEENDDNCERSISRAVLDKTVTGAGKRSCIQSLPFMMRIYIW